jgi:hypothetical protein
MNASLRTLALGAALLCSMQAHAVATASLDDVQLTAYDADGMADAAAVTITGSDRVDTEITAWPTCRCSIPGPGLWDAYAEGPAVGASPLANLISIGNQSIGAGIWGFDLASIGPDSVTGAEQLYATASGAAPFHSLATAASDGRFTLAPHATLTLTAVAEIDDAYSIGSALVTLGLDDGRQQRWIAPPDATRALSLSVSNPGDVAITGTFGLSVFASSVPEPAIPALVLAGVAATGLGARRRSRP